MSTRSAGTWAIRGGVSFLLAGALAAGGYGIAQAAAGPKRAAGSSRATDTLSTSSSTSAPSGSGSGPGWRGWAGGGFGGGVVGTVKSISSGSFTMTTRQARVLTVDTTKSTTYSEARAKVSASALKVGDQVGVAFTRPTAPPSGSSSSASTSSTKTPTASAVAIIVPSLAGQVVSKSGSTIVVKDVQGFERTIDITTATTYSEAGTSVSPSAVTENADVVAFGSVASDNTDLEATSVDIVGPAAGGKVTKVSGTTITVSPPQGGSALTITTTSSTLFRNDAAASSLSAIKVGDVLMAIGARASNGTLAATAIRFGSFSIGGARGTGPFGRGGWLGLAARAATGSNRAGTGGGPAGAGWGRTHGGFRTGSFGGPSGSSSPMVTTS